jgi:hypothetical protein
VLCVVCCLLFVGCWLLVVVGCLLFSCFLSLVSCHYFCLELRV